MELLKTENGKYRIEFMSAATFPGAIQVIRESFCQEESVSVGSGLNKNPAAIEEMLEICADTALDGVSLVAIAVDSGEVVAALLNKIQDADSSERTFFEIFAEERCTQPETHELVKFLTEMDSKINFFERYNVDCLFEIMILGTIPKHRYNGLGKILCKESIEIAKKLKYGVMKISEMNIMTVEDLGPRYSFLPPRKPVTKVPKLVTSVFSAVGSQKIGKALNFKVDLGVSFKEFTNGKTFEEKIGANCFLEACSIMIS